MGKWGPTTTIMKKLLPLHYKVRLLITLYFEDACFYNASHYSDHILFLINMVIWVRFPWVQMSL